MKAAVPGWHAGERALQQRAGVDRRMAEVGARVLRDFMPDQHRRFFAELPFLLVGTIDAEGQPWASVLAGPPGFVQSPTPQLLRIGTVPQPHHAVAGHLRAGAPVALLGLQAHTGRRNRMNGWIDEVRSDGFDVRVGQSFGNCPKYIHPREALYSGDASPSEARSMQVLDRAALRLVRDADTFFIATAHPRAGAARDDPTAGPDVSHRGGAAGFVRVQPDGALLVPDYAGNFFFNTLGNLQLQPRCGLLFIDFATGEQLHIAARGELLPDAPDPQDWPGALRLLRLQVERAVHVRGGLPLRWRLGA